MKPKLIYKNRLFVLIAGGLALAMMVAAVYWLRPTGSAPNPALATPESFPDQGQTAITSQPNSNPTEVGGADEILRQSRSGLLEAEEVEPASESAARIVHELFQLELDGSGIRAEQADAIHQRIYQLAAEGKAAIPAIRDFLERNEDVDFQAGSGTDFVGYWSLRAALFDVLRQIGGVEAQMVLADTLKTTADPAEIAWLAQHLDQQVPGVFRQEAVHAARETLAMAAQGQMPLKDPGPLFRVLQAYGDGSVAEDLAGTTPHWKYYGAMALAGLPGGEGIPALIEQVQRGEGAPGFAVQMLAQAAPLNPQAAAALIEQASTSQLPDWAWQRIATGLAKDQYRFDSPTFDGPVVARRVPGVATYHFNNGSENFWSLPLSPDDPSIGQRIAIIDQLLSVTSDPAAARTLQQARARLAR